MVNLAISFVVLLAVNLLEKRSGSKREKDKTKGRHLFSKCWRTLA